MTQIHSNHPEVPHLTTAITGPLRALEKHFLKHQVEIETWFRKQWQISPPPVTCSVDLRNAGHKIAPVDTNLYPAGFNNLNPAFLPLCIQAAQMTIERYYPGCDRILLLAESHTRNVFYLESIASLQQILIKAGYEAKIGTLAEEITDTKEIHLDSGKTITLYPITRKENRLYLKNLDDFSPCLILLNNDLSGGIPAILENLKQPIRPPLDLSWATRLKSSHFSHYEKICEQFATSFNFDSWLINPLFRQCTNIDFKEREGEECVKQNVELLLQQIKYKYQQYGIKQKPFIVVKADAGTYGMGIMMIEDAEQISQLNRKQRSRMATSKGKQVIDKVIIQEGVHSTETLGDNNAVAEPVIYMLGQFVVGGFYRVHADKGPSENLNAPGMYFEHLAFADCCNNPDIAKAPQESVNRFYAYGVIARLALLAAGRELSEIKYD